jgi:phosphopantetheinyl transferase (holo-ACP synthase)
MKIIERIHNVATGEITDVERDLTPEELKHLDQLNKEKAAKAAEQAAKEEQRAALLDRLGITEEEAKLLLG